MAELTSQKMEGARTILEFIKSVIFSEEDRIIFSAVESARRRGIYISVSGRGAVHSTLKSCSGLTREELKG